LGVEESNSSLGFALPIPFDRVDFTKKDFKREYRMDMYENDKKKFTVYLCSIDKEKASPLQYNPQNGLSRLLFYNINGHYYALEIKGQYLCFSQNQSARPEKVLR